MTNLFKKSVLAAAVLAVGSVSAAQLQEADVSVVGISKQATNSLTTNGGNVLLTAGAAYAVGTEITVTFTGGELTVAPSAASAGDTWTRVAQNATSATFRLTAGDVAIGEKVTFSGHQWTTASVLAAGSINVTAAVKADTGVAIDPAGTNQKLTRLVALVADEFVTAVASGDVVTKTIVLAGGRTAFEGADTAAKSTHLLKVTTTDRTGAPYKDDSGADVQANFAAQATKGQTTYTIAGDFSWVKDTDETKAGVQPHSSAITFGGADCALTSVDAAKAVVTCEAAVSALTITLNVYQGGTKAPLTLNDTDFTISASQAYSAPTGSLVTLADKLIGSWTNDGTTKTVPYMPYGEGTSQILYVTNNSTTVGPIKVTAYDETGKKVLTSVKVGDTVANGITQVSTGVKTALTAAGVTTSKVKLTFDIESKGADLFSAYNVSGDRLATPNRN